MSEADLLILGASAVVIAAIVAVAAMLGFRQRASMFDEHDVRARLAHYDSTLVLRDAALDAKGRAALARLEDGRLAALRALGDRIAVRVFPNTALRRIRLRRPQRGIAIDVRFADLGFPMLTLELDTTEAPAWIEGLRHAAHKR